MDKKTEDLIIESVIRQLMETQAQSAENNFRAGPESNSRDSGSSSEPNTLEPMDVIGVENPHNLEALKVMRKTSPARIFMGRCGARQKTASYLNYMADHAAAIDAVLMDVSEQFIADNDLFKVKTVVKDKDEYLMRPDLGRKLSQESKDEILQKGEKGKQVQIIVVDGLSSTSIEANVADAMPALIQGLGTYGITVGRPFFIKYGRVAIMDEVAPLLDCDVVVEFIGERPGLITAESMSAYMAYRPDHNTNESNRTVVSNIHRNGTPPTEAGAHLATLVKKMIDNKASGIKLAALP
ncbi:ethanolamine ammonia-lyase small subunit [Streptosporangium jomthongense]|uniref:Ethanolamine ammonia-lyase small subunit n=1 Tax=Marinobacter aromaticivorans TaxID=1494078 RepID=A0ABW2IVY6_9GAMM|nr:ethanolamine ammonia-lyase subunit EutC [Marinobacter aromaticivorans]GGE68960.1 ethanolamine ammonia-lyase small subunit [Streptosporangium jomthongense]